MKKLFCLFLSLIIAATSISAFAAADKDYDLETENSKLIQEAMDYAYLDITSAPSNMKQKILDARKIIVTTKDWVADGYTAYIEDENGNLLKKIPAFSEVFPGWELPTDPSPTPTHFWQANASTYSPSISAIDPNAWLFYRAINNVKLLPANDDSIIPFWCVYVNPDTIGDKLKSVVTGLKTSQSCNLHFSNSQTHKMLAYLTYMKTGRTLVMGGVGGLAINAKASTFSTPFGFASFSFYGSERTSNKWD